MKAEPKITQADFPSDIKGKARALVDRMLKLVAQVARMERRIGEQRAEIKDLHARLHAMEKTRTEARERLQRLVGELPER